MGKLRNGAATREQGARKIWEGDKPIYADVKTSKRRLLAEEEVTGAEPLNGEGMDSEPKCRSPALLGRDAPSVVSRRRSRIQR